MLETRLGSPTASGQVLHECGVLSLRVSETMLQQLSVQNLVLFESLEMEFGEGLGVLTGETGAGKSVIFYAIGLLLGGRASAESIRDGAEQGSVTGVFEPRGEVRARIARKLEDAGMPAADTLIVRRVLSRQGRHRAWLNEIPTTLSFIEDIVGEMMEIVGQHQHLSLVREDAQRALIDRWADPGDCAVQMRSAYGAWRDAVRERRKLEAAREERVERLEFAKFQCQEIEALELKEGEYELLEAQLKRARYAEKIRHAQAGAQNALYRREGAAVERIGEACAELRKLMDFDPAYAELVERLETAEAMVSDIFYELESREDDLDDMQDVDSLESRHQELRVAMRRFATDEAGLLERYASLTEEIEHLENLSERMDEIDALVERTYAHAAQCADALDAVRRNAARGFFAEVAEALSHLEMSGATLEWPEDHEAGERRLSAHGWDNVGILFSANKGERLQPLGKVASGGELSRLLLAVKSVMMERDPVSLCLFDEVDTGLGGQAAVAMGQMMREVSAQRQVLAITHLAQIAACADHHHVVEKRVDEGRTVSSTRTLDLDEREREIARMLGGHAQMDASLAHARAMLST